MARQLLTATLRSTTGNVVIDAGAGVIRGVKLMELGKLARFAGEDGKPKQVTITDEHISALLSHAGNRSIPIHLTHEWFDAQGNANADSIEMAARMGAAKNVRKDELGNAVADAYFKEGPERNGILWGAEHNPEDNCFSVVFNYLKDDPKCIPQNFRAADLVPRGAATTALFSDNQPDKTMAITIDDLKAICETPEGKEMLRGALKGHDKASANADDEASAAIEQDPALMSALNITDADKLETDKTLTARMRIAVQSGRATARLAKSVADNKTALMADFDLKIEAAKVAGVGKGALLAAKTEGSADLYTATLTTYKEASKGNEVLAIARMLKDKPELLGEYEVRQRARIAKFSGAAV